MAVDSERGSDYRLKLFKEFYSSDYGWRFPFFISWSLLIFCIYFFCMMEDFAVMVVVFCFGRFKF